MPFAAAGSNGGESPANALAPTMFGDAASLPLAPTVFGDPVGGTQAGQPPGQAAAHAAPAAAHVPSALPPSSGGASGGFGPQGAPGHPFANSAGAPPNYAAAPSSLGPGPGPYGSTAVSPHAAAPAPYAPYGHVPGFAGAGASAFGSYEFNAHENAILTKCAGRAKFAGIVSIVVGALSMMSSCGAFARPDMLMNLPSGIVGIVVGVMLLGVAGSLQSVTQTQGNDIPHLMAGLEKISAAWLTQAIAALVGLALTALILFAVVFLVALFAAAGS